MSSNTIVGLSSPINPDDSVNKMILKSFDSDELVIIHKVDNLEKKNKLLVINENVYDFRINKKIDLKK